VWTSVSRAGRKGGDNALIRGPADGKWSQLAPLRVAAKFVPADRLKNGAHLNPFGASGAIGGGIELEKDVRTPAPEGFLHSFEYRELVSFYVDLDEAEPIDTAVEQNCVNGFELNVARHSGELGESVKTPLSLIYGVSNGWKQEAVAGGRGSGLCYQYHVPQGVCLAVRLETLREFGEGLDCDNSSLGPNMPGDRAGVYAHVRSNIDGDIVWTQPPAHRVLQV
jgi:hypothetical protein